MLTYEVIVTHLVDVSSFLLREKYFNSPRQLPMTVTR